jgi:hypothetical protein
LVNGIAVSIHHVVNCPRFPAVAFIFDERVAGMVNRWCAAIRCRLANGSGVNLTLNRICLKRYE